MTAKILCLPGFGTNAEFMQHQLRQLAKLHPQVQFIPIDPCFKTSDAVIMDPSVLKKIKEDFRSWTTVGLSPEKQEQIVVQYIDSKIKEHNNVVGLLGFSQGCGAVGRYIFNYKNRLQFVILVSPFYSTIFSKLEMTRLPCLFIVGEEDFLFTSGLLVMSKFIRPRVIVHRLGHKFPQFNYRQLQVIRQFVKGKQTTL